MEVGDRMISLLEHCTELLKKGKTMSPGMEVSIYAMTVVDKLARVAFTLVGGFPSD